MSVSQYEKSQFPTRLLDYSSQYGSQRSTPYSALNILGKPAVYPYYGDSSYTFTTKEYGRLWKCRSTSGEFSPPKNGIIDPQDFIEVSFQYPVIPKSIHIYETFNPGSIVRIFALNPYTKRWIVLWSDRPQIVPKKSLEFIPPIKRIKFPVQIIRLEFDHSLLDYYGAIDGISITGLKRELPIATALAELCTEIDIFNVKCVASKSDQQNITDVNHFETLPVEIIRFIFSQLDLVSLCKVSCVARNFRKIAYDPLLNKDLYLKPHWYMVTSRTFLGLLESRIKLCTKLDLSWCGGRETLLLNKDFVHFIEKCGRQLTSLKLACCTFLDDNLVNKIAEFCCNLEELDLQQYSRDSNQMSPFNDGINLKNLKLLNLYNANMHWSSLNKILSHCQKLEDLNLSCYDHLDGDGVDCPVFKIYSLKHLKRLDLWRCSSLTTEHASMIVCSCPMLEDLNIGWCRQFLHADLQEFITKVATYGKNLKSLCMAAFRFLQISRDLTYLDISSCNISPMAVLSWKLRFPNVEIKNFRVLMND
ncbi:F-box/LRR-repeat protein 4 [Nymphon striatum]|nr:F-box/LRR-repeat protein 4 [Nymphon striatum]